MKSIYKAILVFIAICFFFSSCREGIIEPVRSLELYVVDTLGEPVPNAKVEFYLTESALTLEGETLLEPFYTDEQGIVRVALDPDIFDYYVNIEKDELSNWYTNTVINLPLLQGVNITTITINKPFEVALTGKNKKRWQQTADILNGNQYVPNCSNQLYYDFIRRPERAKEERNGQLERLQSDVCPFPEKPVDSNIWSYNKENNTITFGVASFAETFTITEFTGDRMILVSKTSDNAFIKEKRYELVD
ncbi:hypothetical protein [Bernardetia sp.]|uniref:hypothetical protein n=1 Tax=Bernardetia sp. TaxID=1937974 RepID=UPI0025BECA24|nr:hypothetical protein [Bernardetia sp.]